MKAYMSAFLLFALLASAQDKPKPPMPVNPFVDAKVGDFWTIHNRGPGGTGTLEWRVKKIEGDKLSLAWKDFEDDDEKEPTEFTSNAKAPTLDLYDLHTIAGDIKTEDDTREQLGKKFACKKLTFKLENGVKVKAWFCAAAKGGLVAAEMSDEQGPTGYIDLVGYGSGDKVEYGHTAKAFVAPKIGDEVQFTCDSNDADWMDEDPADLQKKLGLTIKPSRLPFFDGKKVTVGKISEGKWFTPADSEYLYASMSSVFVSRHKGLKYK